MTCYGTIFCTISPISLYMLTIFVHFCWAPRGKILSTFTFMFACVICWTLIFEWKNTLSIWSFSTDGSTFWKIKSPILSKWFSSFQFECHCLTSLPSKSRWKYLMLEMDCFTQSLILPKIYKWMRIFLYQSVLHSVFLLALIRDSSALLVRLRTQKRRRSTLSKTWSLSERACLGASPGLDEPGQARTSPEESGPDSMSLDKPRQAGRARTNPNEPKRAGQAWTISTGGAAQGL